MKYHHLSTAARDEIVCLYAKGFSTLKIARRFQCTTNAISYTLKQRGVATRVQGDHTLLLTRYEAAYIAGLLDGEGSIFATKRVPRRRGRQLRLVISSTTKSVLLWIKSRCGGYIGVANSNKRHHKIKSTKICWAWHASCTHAFHVLRKLLPFLRIKKKKTIEILRITHKQWLTSKIGLNYVRLT